MLKNRLIWRALLKCVNLTFYWFNYYYIFTIYWSKCNIFQLYFVVFNSRGSLFYDLNCSMNRKILVVKSCIFFCTRINQKKQNCIIRLNTGLESKLYGLDFERKAIFFSITKMRSTSVHSDCKLYFTSFI